jgi:hypothetical protein
MNDNEANKEKILAELNEYLTEDRDRQLFNLPPINEFKKKNTILLKRNFKSFEEADSFSKRFLNMNGFTSIKEVNGTWLLIMGVLNLVTNILN